MPSMSSGRPKVKPGGAGVDVGPYDAGEDAEENHARNP